MLRSAIAIATLAVVATSTYAAEPKLGKSRAWRSAVDGSCVERVVAPGGFPLSTQWFFRVGDFLRKSQSVSQKLTLVALRATATFGESRPPDSSPHRTAVLL